MLLLTSEYGMWDLYGKWLIDHVGFEKWKAKYQRLMNKLHHVPFSFCLERDQNRARDGVALREEFGDWYGCTIGFQEGCSVLEMLVKLSIRIEYEYLGDPKDEHPEQIFIELIQNLGLWKFDDGHFDEGAVEEILDRWMSRNFEPNGVGSIFPLARTERDQRELEIWFQMTEYLSEQLAGLKKTRVR